MAPEDPILHLREVFDAIEPSLDARKRWSEVMHAARLRRATEPRLDEPMPWRMLIGSAAASLAATIAVAAGLLSPAMNATDAARAAEGGLTDSVMAVAAPVMAAQAPDGTRMHLHIPDFGVDWRAQWEALISAVAAPFDAAMRS